MQRIVPYYVIGCSRSNKRLQLAAIDPAIAVDANGGIEEISNRLGIDLTERSSRVGPGGLGVGSSPRLGQKPLR